MSLIGGIWVCPQTLENFKAVPLWAIARSLGRLPRFCANTERMVSILTHSIACASIARQLDCLAPAIKYMLTHDVPECVVSDRVSDFKTDADRAIEDQIMAIFAAEHHIDVSFHAPLDWIDKDVGVCEAQEYNLRNWTLAPKLQRRVAPVVIREVRRAKQLFPFERTANDERLWHEFAYIVKTGDMNCLT